MITKYSTTKLAFKEIAEEVIDDPWISESATKEVNWAIDQIGERIMELATELADAEGVRTVKDRHVLKALVMVGMKCLSK